MNRVSAQVAPLKLASRPCSVASSEDTSPQNVIFNLPEDLNDDAKNTSGDRTSSRYTGSTRDSSGSGMNTVGGDEPANNVNDGTIARQFLPPPSTFLYLFLFFFFANIYFPSYPQNLVLLSLIEINDPSPRSIIHSTFINEGRDERG